MILVKAYTMNLRLFFLRANEVDNILLSWGIISARLKVQNFFIILVKMCIHVYVSSNCRVPDFHLWLE